MINLCFYLFSHSSSLPSLSDSFFKIISCFFLFLFVFSFISLMCFWNEFSFYGFLAALKSVMEMKYYGVFFQVTSKHMCMCTKHYKAKRHCKACKSLHLGISFSIFVLCMYLYLLKCVLFSVSVYIVEVRNSRVTKSSYETQLRKMTSHFELLTWSGKIKTYTSSY